ncbi:MAG: hypothetical protein L0Y58_25420 [Verrucomicrobia subdivision 3 bacterium]|nr:hypothetical protein [Gemmataceae bacterium]MCI0748762.1 hypothetical protein [Limisphaerales bacterium]
MAQLHERWKFGLRGVVALVGLGGAGKTAVAARFLEDLLNANVQPRPRGLFVWSFYQEPDAGRFLQRLYEYVAADRAPDESARGMGLLHLICAALSPPPHERIVTASPPQASSPASIGPQLLVLDGLERVQKTSSSGFSFGQVEDPLLRALLIRIAEGVVGNTAALVTSRFPLTDLQGLQSPLPPGRGELAPGCWQIEIGGLDQDAAMSLLRQRDVKGNESALFKLVESYGAHALTLDHLGGLIGAFLDGDPGRAPEVGALAAPEGDQQALRLTRLLRAYEKHLPPAELALLCRLCLVRRSTSVEQIEQLFLCTPVLHARFVREIPDILRRALGVEEQLGAEETLELNNSIRDTVEQALSESPLAGPESAFRRELVAIVEDVVDQVKKNVAIDFGELARFYADKDLDSPTDLLPLCGPDRAGLRAFYTRFAELSEHPLMPCPDIDPALEKAFATLGYSSKPRAQPTQVAGELQTHDVLQSFQSVQRRLRYLAGKHSALRRVRELCRRAQRKWALSGPLAELEAGELRRALDSLVARHLVLREADGAFNVHPAVRDHFYRVATMVQAESWHDLLREQLVSLAQRPGVRCPEDGPTLDLVEEAVYYALQAGRTEEAWRLYNDLLGGVRQLAWKLGEAARGLRILKEFDPCPDRWALGWFLRALGDLEEAYQQNTLAYFRADIRLLQGRLPQVAAEGDDARTAIAEFLMGRMKGVPPDPLGCTVPRAQLLLYLRRSAPGQGASREQLYHDIGWEGYRARILLFLAEAARRGGDERLSRQHLQDASRWILHSGSVEHLCVYHLMRARLLRTRFDFESAQRALSEGIPSRASSVWGCITSSCCRNRPS